MTTIKLSPKSNKNENMNNEIFDLSSRCNIYIVDATMSEITDWAWRINRNSSTIIRFVRGHKSKTAEKLFDEFAAALQFPYYFGENWDAFDECISDLEWLNGDAFGVVIFNANELLCQMPTDLDILIRDIASSNLELKEAGKRFVTIFHCEGAHKANFSQKLHSLGALFQEIDIKTDSISNSNQM